MKRTLVIVESSGKISTIKAILGTKYSVIASNGHIYELKSVSDAYVPKYVISSKLANHVNKIKKAAEDASDVILATDNDREGEFIAWSLAHFLKIKEPRRIIFNSITKDEITAALNNVTGIDMKMVYSQQARAILDMLIGYRIQPLLTSNKLSVGRVQSVITKLIIERDAAITINDPYFKITCNIQGSEFTLKTPDKLTDTKLTGDILSHISKHKHAVNKISIKEIKKHAPLPFTTNTLQQAAYTRLNINNDVCMSQAQYLYESGYITYMRTDSTSLSTEFKTGLLTYIQSTYGKEYVNEVVKSKSKTALIQGAHEAIRPVNLSVKTTPKHSKLYALIYNNTVASHMTDAIYESRSVEVNTYNDYVFVSTIQKIIFNGWMALSKSQEGGTLTLNKGDKVTLTNLKAEQQYLTNKKRYTRSTLINRLDPSDLGIGRPSTYASIINKILKREYVKIDNITGKQVDVICITQPTIGTKQKITSRQAIIGDEKNVFIPTKLGILLTQYLEKHFPTMMDYMFTRTVETDLDLIATTDATIDSVLDSHYKSVIYQSIIDNKQNKNTFGKHVHKEVYNDGKHSYTIDIAWNGCLVLTKRLGANKVSAISLPKELPDNSTIPSLFIDFDKNLGTYDGEALTKHLSSKGDWYTIYKHIYIPLPNKEATLKDVEEYITSQNIKRVVIIDNKLYVIHHTPDKHPTVTIYTIRTTYNKGTKKIGTYEIADINISNTKLKNIA